MLQSRAVCFPFTLYPCLLLLPLSLFYLSSLFQKIERYTALEAHLRERRRFHCIIARLLDCSIGTAPLEVTIARDNDGLWAEHPLALLAVLTGA